MDNEKVPTARENAYGIHLLNCVVVASISHTLKGVPLQRGLQSSGEVAQGRYHHKVFNPHGKALVTEKKDLTIDQYVNEALDLQRDLKGAGETLTEQAFCVALLKGLPTDYDTIKQMMMRKETEDLNLRS